MSSSSRVGAAIAAGYFLGRFKKLRLALVVGSALANKNLRDSGLSMLQQKTQGLASSPEAKKLGQQISGQLMEAGKAAAVSAAASRIDKLSDQMNQRAGELRELAGTGTGSAQTDEDEQASDDLADQEQDDQDQDDQDQVDQESDEEEPTDEADEADEDQESDDEDEPTDEADEADEDEEEDEDEDEDEADEDEPTDEAESDEEESDEDEPDEEDEEDDESRSAKASKRSSRRRRSAAPTAGS